VKRPDPPRARLRHPVRDSAIVYGILALVIVLGAALTGSGLVRGLIIAIAFFLAATAWNWWRFRRRLEQRSDR
jgi:hypothetical protein